MAGHTAQYGRLPVAKETIAHDRNCLTGRTLCAARQRPPSPSAADRRAPPVTDRARTSVSDRTARGLRNRTAWKRFMNAEPHAARHVFGALLSSLLLIPFCQAAPVPGSEPTSSSALVDARPGDLPIVILAPHGGTAGIPEVPARTRGSKLTDSYTSELAESTAVHIEELLGASPYLVIARFKRRYLDVNRSRDEGVESELVMDVYDAYHGAVANFVTEMRRRFPRGALLLDIHGQKQEPATIFRGTRDGLTVNRMLHRHGSNALTGPRSIMGILKSRGYQVFPPDLGAASQPEHPDFAGGFTGKPMAVTMTAASTPCSWRSVATIDSMR